MRFEDRVCTEAVMKTKWYHYYRFPIFPEIKFKSADRYNVWRLGARWLIFRFWTTHSLCLRITFEIDETIMLIFQFPYFICGIFIPLTPLGYLYKFSRQSEQDKRYSLGDFS